MWTYKPGFIGNPDVAFKHLSTQLAWVKMGNTPRLEYYANLHNEPYTYGSGMGVRTYPLQPWDNEIENIRKKLLDEAGIDYDVCFLNRYVNQSDSLGWHADDSPEMDGKKPIAIVSFGVEREIWFRPYANPNDITKLKLGHGSLCLMHAGMQKLFQHRIPKASFACGERISMTYRGFVF